MGIGALLLANWVAGFDRRRLLALTLAWYAAGHALSALMPDYAALAAVRALCMLGAAVFTPQAAAAIGYMTPPAQRGCAITFVFLGWSLASVAGMPIAAWIGETFGWRAALATVAALAAAAALWVHRGDARWREAAGASRAAWREAFTHPVLMAISVVTGAAGGRAVHALLLLRVLLPPDAGGNAGADQRPLLLVRPVRPDRQRAADAAHRSLRRCALRGRRAGADHAVAAGLAAGRQLRGHGAGAGALGAGCFSANLGAAGALSTSRHRHSRRR